ncbi:hypothetical protein PV10_08187 [Exophiala mesophila]|uniref:AB hydrolase-1 domain-containing protein n=1 Tax=Exophiala mesophila TaxID=212818 RepID=A0A0D1XK10_EXOME|nr:uncharacterized protein PV10_08187 [Exophiala mesophila]KIV88506.1 hypothetical protein PV10_08187 [Exophiala mesophila]
MSATKPSVVIIPGSFSPDYFYFDIVKKLQEYGYEAQVKNLPSASRLPPEQPATMYEDADFFRGLVEQLADQGKDVVLVTHSYGGVVGSEAAKGVLKTDREAAGKPGGLVKLVYLTSVVPEPGVSLGGQMGATLPTTIEIEETGFMRQTKFEVGSKECFSDLPLEEAIEWGKKMSKQSAVSFSNELTYPGYKYVPVSYIFCEQDQILRPDFQTSVIAGIEKMSGNKVDVRRLNTGHCPNVSNPLGTAKVIAEAIVGA